MRHYPFVIPIYINEGPQALARGESIHIVYSASFSQTDNYCLGLLTMARVADPLDPASWTKSDGCLFETNQAASVFGPGHNFLIRSPDGSEWLNVYHANLVSNTGWKGRSVRVQRFGWDSEDRPVFGAPVSYDAVLAVPAGESGADRSRVEAEYGVMQGVEVRWDREASSQQVVVQDGTDAWVEMPLLRGRGSRLALRCRSEDGGSVIVSNPAGKELHVPPTGEQFGVVEWRADGSPTRAPVTVLWADGEIEIDALELR
jgi:hypothetical protein